MNEELFNRMSRSKKRECWVRFQVLVAAKIKMPLLWLVSPCSLVEVYRCFRGACYLHRQGDEWVAHCSLCAHFFPAIRRKMRKRMMIFSGSGKGKLAWSCRHGNEPSGSVKREEFLDWLSALLVTSVEGLCYMVISLFLSTWFTQETKYEVLNV
jgi:hypothetical protein